MSEQSYVTAAEVAEALSLCVGDAPAPSAVVRHDDWVDGQAVVAVAKAFFVPTPCISPKFAPCTVRLVVMLVTDAEGQNIPPFPDMIQT